MARHENKACPRCGRLFECKAGSVLLCQCAEVELQQRHYDFIATRYSDCLCAECLRALRAECDS
ncbi:MAG: cysteine-rich CWC family protein [Granulosicoccaceae bacterium]|jgi:hypothetical protein